MYHTNIAPPRTDRQHASGLYARERAVALATHVHDPFPFWILMKPTSSVKEAKTGQLFFYFCGCSNAILNLRAKSFFNFFEKTSLYHFLKNPYQFLTGPFIYESLNEWLRSKKLGFSKMACRERKHFVFFSFSLRMETCRYLGYTSKLSFFHPYVYEDPYLDVRPALQ